MNDIYEKGIPFETLCQIGKDRIGDIEDFMNNSKNKVKIK